MERYAEASKRMLKEAPAKFMPEFKARERYVARLFSHSPNSRWANLGFHYYSRS